MRRTTRTHYDLFDFFKYNFISDFYWTLTIKNDFTWKLWIGSFLIQSIALGLSSNTDYGLGWFAFLTTLILTIYGWSQHQLLQVCTPRQHLLLSATSDTPITITLILSPYAILLHSTRPLNNLRQPMKRGFIKTLLLYVLIHELREGQVRTYQVGS